MKQLETNEVYTFKITSGEEIISKVLSQTENTIVLSDPLSVAPNQHGIGLMPSMFTVDNEKPVELNTNTITMYGVTVDQVRIKYIEATTGITTASKKILVG